MNVEALAQALEASALGVWMRAGWGYPLVNVLHLAGLVLLVGPICLLDLRLLGAGRALPVPAASRLLTPVAITGLLLMLLTGAALFSADASTLVDNRLMQLKLSAVAIAIANALLFRMLFARRLPDWDRRPPPLGRIMAALSLLLWPVAMVAGRMIAYV